MYSFAQRLDTKVFDEPFYAHYLLKTGLKHPGREGILATTEGDYEKILIIIQGLEEKYEVVFLKNMAHHHEEMDWSYLLDMHNVFLIRDPRQLIASFARVIENPTLLDIGLKHETDLLDYAMKSGSYTPIVVDSNSILQDPKKGISALCERLDISFEKGMLAWEKGPIPEDGYWAKYWYHNIHNSTGFVKQKTSNRPLPGHCQPLYEEALPYYKKLVAYLNF